MIANAPTSAIVPGDRAHLHADQFAERAPVAAHRDEQDHEILHRARQHDADEDPQRAGQIAHLRGQHRPDQRPRAGDRGEMVAEQDAPVGRDVIEPVGAANRRRRSRRIDAAARGVAMNLRVEAIRDQIGAERRGDDPQRVDAARRARWRRRPARSRPSSASALQPILSLVVTPPLPLCPTVSAAVATGATVFYRSPTFHDAAQITSPPSASVQPASPVDVQP